MVNTFFKVTYIKDKKKILKNNLHIEPEGILNMS